MTDWSKRSDAGIRVGNSFCEWVVRLHILCKRSGLCVKHQGQMGKQGNRSPIYLRCSLENGRSTEKMGHRSDSRDTLLAALPIANAPHATFASLMYRASFGLLSIAQSRMPLMPLCQCYCQLSIDKSFQSPNRECPSCHVTRCEQVSDASTTVALRKGGIVPGIFLGKFP